jgi:hypothetical protein
MGRRAGGALILIEFMYQHPMVSVNDMQRVTGLSFPSANELAVELEGLALLNEQTGNRRNRVFAYRPYLDIILD